MERYRLREERLAAATEAAAGRAEGSSAFWESGEVFADRLDLAGAAQNAWWHGIFARVDATLSDDVSAVAPEVRFAAIRDAWDAQLRATPGYLPLAALGVGDPGHDSNRRRYARLLALFAGTADVGDDPHMAAEAGLDLVRQLSAGRPLVAMHP